MKINTKAFLLCSVLLMGNLFLSAQERFVSREEMYSDLKEEGLLLVFSTYEVHKKTVEKNQVLEKRFNEMVAENEKQIEDYIQTFKNHYNYSNVYYIEAKEGDLDKVRGGDFSEVKVIKGDKSEINKSGNLILVYPFSEVAAFHSKGGVFLKYLDKSKKLPKNFPRNIRIGPTSFRYMFFAKSRTIFYGLYFRRPV